MKQVAITGGGDWADASVEHLAVPDNLDVAAEYRKYRHWISNIYSKQPPGPHYPPDAPHIPYQTFTDWLRKLPGVTESSVEVFDTENSED